MRIKSITLGLMLGLVCATPAWAKSAGELLSAAISISANLDMNTSIERRLDERKRMFKAVNQLLEQHPGSPEAIKIISRQSIGNFDYAKQQDLFLRDLNDYQKSTCAASPSLECLAFVSLDEGQQECAAAGASAQEQAHGDLLNAIRIFVSQGSDDLYVDLAINAYRSCSFGRGQNLQDAYMARLVPHLLALDRKDSARAIVQQIKQPYWKFEAVMAQLSSSEINDSTITRLEKYLDDRLVNNQWDFWLASLKLHTFAVTNLGQPSKRSIHRNPTLYSAMPSGAICDDGWRQLHFERVVEMVDAVMESLEESGATSMTIDRAIDHLELYSIAQRLDMCESPKSYGVGVTLYTYLRLMGASYAADFLADANTSDFDESIMQETAFSAYKSNPDLFLKNADAVRMAPFDEFYGFKLSVFEGDVCGAVGMMFEKFVDTPLYPRAVSYLLRSGDVDLEADYDCGDADLEALLM